MESQEFKMLQFMRKIETRPIKTSDFFDSILSEFDSTDLAEILIMKLYNQGYIYTCIKEDRFALGNTKVILTDKGNKYLDGNKIQKWFIRNGSSAVTWGNIIALISFSISTILNLYFNIINR